MRQTFYRETVRAWLPDRSASVLVVAGGRVDRDILRDLGFRDVTITNMDSSTPDGGAWAPFRWQCEDAHQLSLADGAVDYAVVHAGLHHCQSPHRALTEMYRVARRGVLVIEARDSLAVRLVTRLGFSQPYEHFAVYAAGGQQGGMNDSAIPNYVYRWSERDVEKTIRSYDPAGQPVFRYRYGLATPSTATGRLRRALVRLGTPIARALHRLAPSQGNLFAFLIEKPTRVQPWIARDGAALRFNTAWADRHYGPRVSHSPTASTPSR